MDTLAQSLLTEAHPNSLLAFGLAAAQAGEITDYKGKVITWPADAFLNLSFEQAVVRSMGHVYVDSQWHCWMDKRLTGILGNFVRYSGDVIATAADDRALRGLGFITLHSREVTKAGLWFNAVSDAYKR